MSNENTGNERFVIRYFCYLSQGPALHKALAPRKTSFPQHPQGANVWEGVYSFPQHPQGANQGRGMFVSATFAGRKSKRAETNIPLPI